MKHLAGAWRRGRSDDSCGRLHEDQASEGGREAGKQRSEEDPAASGFTLLATGSLSGISCLFTTLFRKQAEEPRVLSSRPVPKPALGPWTLLAVA